MKIREIDEKIELLCEKQGGVGAMARQVADKEPNDLDLNEIGFCLRHSIAQLDLIDSAERLLISNPFVTSGGQYGGLLWSLLLGAQTSNESDFLDRVYEVAVRARVAFCSIEDELMPQVEEFVSRYEQ
jgi:hypothetical protein